MRHQLPTYNLLRAEYRGYRVDNTHVRCCFFFGMLGTSLVSADEAQRNLMPISRRKDIEGVPMMLEVDVATTGEVWS